MTAQHAIIQSLPIASILAPSNIRLSNGHDKESLSQLADSIKTHGLLQPILVRNAVDDETQPYVIVAGRRRLAASKLAGLHDVPAIVTATDEAKAYELEIAENIQREQMTLGDTARAVRTLMLIHDSAKKVGEVVNKSPAWVSKHLTITSNTVAPPVAELLDRNIVGDLATLLMLNTIAKMQHPDAASTLTRLLRISHEGNMNRQIAQDALAKLKTPKGLAPAPTVTTTHTKAHHETTVEQGDAEPRRSFTIELPIEVLEEYERRCAAGGSEWLSVMLTQGTGPYGDAK